MSQKPKPQAISEALRAEIAAGRFGPQFGERERGVQAERLTSPFLLILYKHINNKESHALSFIPALAVQASL